MVIYVMYNFIFYYFTLEMIIYILGYVTTVAGSQSGGFRDGFGTNSQFSVLQGLAVDTVGNIFVCDNYAVRKIDTIGLILLLLLSLLLLLLLYMFSRVCVYCGWWCS